MSDWNTDRERPAQGRAPAAALALLAAAFLAVLTGLATGGRALAGELRLIMVDDPNCVYCRRWDAEVGHAYPRSAEGERAPLVRVRRGDPALAAFKPAIYTPTFILVGPQGEVGRIVGYPGQDFFWAELAELIAMAGPPGTPPPAPRAEGEQPGPGVAAAGPER
jgi:hypothetical protein